MATGRKDRESHVAPDSGRRTCRRGSQFPADRCPARVASPHRFEVEATLWPAAPGGTSRCASLGTTPPLYGGDGTADSGATGPVSPAGRARWNGHLLAQALGDVSPYRVWAVLRQHGIELERRHSWCVSTDPEFARKAADVVGLYLDPPAGAVVLGVDEKPAIQALERAQGWLRLPNGRSLQGFNHEYKRHGTTTLFAALEVFTGTVTTAHYPRRQRREFLDFMNQIVTAYPGRELHVIVNNLSTHKPKHDRWQARHPNAHFHYTPTHASWLNQVECWFSILSRQALRGASFTSVVQLRQAIDRFVVNYNQTAAPFEWTKRFVQPSRLKHRYADLRN